VLPSGISCAFGVCLQERRPSQDRHEYEGEVRGIVMGLMKNEQSSLLNPHC